MFLRFGNLSPERFAARVDSEFTPDELEYLGSVWSQNATLTGPDDFHIFNDPAIAISIGSTSSRTLEVFKAANSRKSFNRPVDFNLDDKFGVTEP